MIQYLPAETPAVYRVVVLELASGEVRPVRGRFKTPPQRMPGVRLGQVFDPITSQMYTLYSNRPGDLRRRLRGHRRHESLGGASYGSGPGAQVTLASKESRGVGEESDASGSGPRRPSCTC